MPLLLFLVVVCLEMSDVYLISARPNITSDRNTLYIYEFMTLEHDATTYRTTNTHGQN